MNRPNPGPKASVSAQALEQSPWRHGPFIMAAAGWRPANSQLKDLLTTLCFGPLEFWRAPRYAINRRGELEHAERRGGG